PGAEVPKGFLDRFDVIDREVHAPGTAALVMVLLHRDADGQTVDDWYHFAQVPRQQPVEQHLVAVVHRGQVDVLIERIRQGLVLGVGRLYLSFQRADDWGEQTGEAQRLSFLDCESRALV